MKTLGVWLLGAWLGMLLASWAVATVNFRTVDRVLGKAARPEMAERLAGVPAAERRVVLRHLASEINRWMFRWWSAAQLVLGVLALAAVWSGAVGARFAVAAALLIVAAQLGLLAPSIVDLGRSIDFVPRPLPAETARRFGLLHGAYVLADLVKAAALAAAAWLAART
jgi:hypothetical protein